MDELKNTALIEKRLELLRQFHDALDRWLMVRLVRIVETKFVRSLIAI